MNEQAKMMIQSQMMNPSQMMSLNQGHVMSMNQPPPQMLNQPPQQVMNHKPPMSNISQTHQIIGQSPMMMNQTQSQAMNQPQMMMNQAQPQMLNRNYGIWRPSHMDQLKFQNPVKPPGGFAASKKLKPLGRSNWKGKKGNDKRKDGGRKEKSALPGPNGIGVGGSGGVVGGGAVGGGGYQPPTLGELQHQNRLKARRFFKKKFNNYNSRSAPYAPRNTSSYIIRAKKSGGIASLVSPCPVTPAVLPTPIFSPSREVLVDMAKEEWGVDGYGSMKGLIRLRSPGNEIDPPEDEDEDGGGSSESDVEEHVEVERRLDHDLSRFEMIYPNSGGEYNNVLENRVDDQDTHIAHLEEENLILKERLFLMERELGDLRWRLQCLERQNHEVEEIQEEVLENESENESDSHGDAHSFEEHNEKVAEENNEGALEVKMKENNNAEVLKHEAVGDDCMEDAANEKGGAAMDEHNEKVSEENNEGAIEVKMKENNNVEVSEHKTARDDSMEDAANEKGGAAMDEKTEDGWSEKSIGDGDH